ncbi:MAG: hypothetical protein GXP31_09435 [Kiritimatiellaeota bacterium]|nr:hypothetical protein [Kiritimatiellota bacterium]
MVWKQYQERTRHFAVCLIALLGLSWINYDDRVEKKTPVFGKDFAGFSLKLFTEKVDFAQDLPEPVTVVLKNNTNRASIFPAEAATKGRFVRLYFVLADKNGNSLFSDDLLRGKDHPLVRGKIAPHTELTVLKTPFNSLKFAKVEEFEHGMPFFDPRKSRFVPAAELVPQLYVMKALLISGLPDRRPDFVVASDRWPLLIRPRSGDRMSDAEKKARLRRYLAKMKQGAYGGIGVSSQLAALGEVAVEPLIRMADRKGDGKVFESRVWAIVTLCNIRSPKASAYILKRLKNPVSLADLNFLAWHSQACRDPAIEREIRSLVNAILEGKPLPWRPTPVPQGIKDSFLEFCFKRFASLRQSISDETAAACLRWPNPKPISFGLAVWKPGSPQKAIELLAPMFVKISVHPILKRIILSRLSDALQERGFPEFDRNGDAEAQWHRAGLWLFRSGALPEKQKIDFLRAEVLSVRKSTEVKKDILALLRQTMGEASPVKRAIPRFPEDWTAAWRWALHAGPLPAEQAVKFLCSQMRTKEEIPASTKRALLIELKNFIGPGFPLPRTDRFELDAAWSTCGNWLIEHGFFGKPPAKKAAGRKRP